MTYPAGTTLSDIVDLAVQQYGIRFQITPEQFVSFANMIQMIAYNNDLAAFEEWNQKLYLGQDVFSALGSYTSPVEADIGKTVDGSVSGAGVGTLLNYKTENRLNQWIIEPPDGGVAISLTAGETLSINTGTGSCVVAEGQEYKVSDGPYRYPRTTTDSNPPFRKFIGITKVTDLQIFGNNREQYGDGLDYGFDLNSYPDREMNIPSRPDDIRKEVKLITDGTLEITQSSLGATAPATVNDSPYRWVYYRNPPLITNVNNETQVILPEEYRYEVLYDGMALLADVATYGEKGTVREIIAPLCERFWEDKGVQFQAFGKANDFISQGEPMDTFHASGYGNNNRNFR